MLYVINMIYVSLLLQIPAVHLNSMYIYQKYKRNECIIINVIDRTELMQEII